MAGGCSPIRYLHNSSKSLSFTWKLLLQKTPRPTKINLPRNCSPPFGGTFWKSSQEIPALPNSARETPSEKTTATGFGRNFTSAIVCSTAFPAATKSSSTLGSMTKPPCEKPAQKQIRTRFSETCSHPAIRQAASVSSSAHPRKSPRRVGMNRGNSPRQSRRKPSDSLRGERNSAVQSMEIALTVPPCVSTLTIMVVHLKPETESRLQELAATTGRAPDELVEDAMTGYLAELSQVRGTLDSRYDEVKSGRLRPIDGENAFAQLRSEEHTSELQSRSDLVCRLL